MKCFLRWRPGGYRQIVSLAYVGSFPSIPATIDYVRCCPYIVRLSTLETIVAGRVFFLFVSFCLLFVFIWRLKLNYLPSIEDCPVI